MRYLPHALRAATITVTLACAVSAQTTFIVDSTNAPGTNFTEIQAAIDAATAGDRIVVRGTGGYSGFDLDKPLSIVADGGAIIAGAGPIPAISIHDLPPNTDTVVRGLTLFLVSPAPGIDLRDNAGRLLMDNVGYFTSGGNMISDCSQVILNGGRWIGGVTIERSSVSLSDVFVAGSGELPPSAAGPGLVLDQATVHLSRTIIDGGQAFPLGGTISAEAIAMTNSTVIAGGTASHTLSAGNAFGATSGIPVITGDGVLVLDPDIPLVPLNGAAATVGAFSVTNPQIPTLKVSGGNVGGTSTVDLEATPGESFFLLVGQPGNSVPLPAFGGELWLNLAATALISAGTIDSTGTQQWSYPVPNTLAVLGVQVHWAAVTGISNFRLTSPTGYGHGR